MKHHLPKTPILVVGMKMDLRTDEATIEKLKLQNEAPISFEEGTESIFLVCSYEGVKMAQQIGATKYVECSSLKNINMDVVLEAVVQCLSAKQKLTKKKYRNCVLM